ncbi:hypothetical protein QJ854_gp125 [Moumouvirus goulette]|uniref:Uncharacterized protein n=1 Tax=Moumouvirus goulette TaxID=1247379 RepID=M1PXZ6_9VIRU|nr:hypothetical protein QJ854_gp125 [Moumouvirus goulette]AGF85657.1 hypothetical protein glt_00852 [Moumouvirus goulette]
MYNFDLVYEIILGNSEISLKLIDWFVTKYSKKYNIIFGNNFNVYEEYRFEIRTHKKEYFDIYCRKHKGIFYVDYNNQIKLSIGQINFFNWCLKNDIINYIKNNQSDIIQDMNFI